WKGKRSSIPFLRRLMLKAENQSYWLDREAGRIRIPIRGTEGVQLHLPLAEWHRSILGDPSWGLGSLTVVSGKIIVVLRKEAPKPYEPRGTIALDTNEDSLDGVQSSGDSAGLLRVPFEGVRRIQEIHYRRRRKIARKKAAHDRRVARRLLNREGRRERHRVRHRLHRVSKGLVRLATEAQAAIVLEDLTLHGAGGRSRRMNRRLSSWPRREIHRQIEYKAALEGVPIIKVNPAWTSKTCPVCGARRRDRVGKVFVCLMCDWEMDRQINAGMNILKTALASNEALARAVRFQPGALRHDVVGVFLPQQVVAGDAAKGLQDLVPDILRHSLEIFVLREVHQVARDLLKSLFDRGRLESEVEGRAARCATRRVREPGRAAH